MAKHPRHECQSKNQKKRKQNVDETCEKTKQRVCFLVITEIEENKKNDPTQREGDRKNSIIKKRLCLVNLCMFKSARLA